MEADGECGAARSDTAQRVLVVEDEPMIARILEHKLRREGWTVHMCDSSAAAEQVLRAQPVEAALVDATLEVDGLAWAGGLAVCGHGPRRGWLALVEARDPGAPRRARDHGAADVVVKPFKPTVVAAQVRRLIDGAGTTDPGAQGGGAGGPTTAPPPGAEPPFGP